MFYWYGLIGDVALHIRKCDVCASNKKPMKIPRAPMGLLRTGAPGDCLATDNLGPFPVNDRGNRYILLLTDHFTKYVEILPVPDMTAETCATKIINEYVLWQFIVIRGERMKAKSSKKCAACLKFASLEPVLETQRGMGSPNGLIGLCSE